MPGLPSESCHPGSCNGICIDRCKMSALRMSHSSASLSNSCKWLWTIAARLKPWVDGLAFKRQHAEYTFVDSPKRLHTDESFESLDAESELSYCQRTLSPQPTLPKPGQMLLSRVLRPVDDAQILAAAAFHCGLC